MPKTDVHAVFISRLKQARIALGVSQTALGLKMGLPDDSASARINRYERGVSEPDLRTAEQMARALGVSLSWLVCTDATLATMIDGFTRLDAAAQGKLLAQLERALTKAKPKREALPAKLPKAKPAAKTPVAKAPVAGKKAKAPSKT